MSLPFSHPWILVPAGAVILIVMALALRAQLRPGLGVQVVGQRPIWQGLGLALMAAGLGLGLAEPRWGLPEFPRLTVHVALDASRSMAVPDANGRTRWDAAVAALDRIWSRPQPGLRWSLDLLTGDAIPIQPPGEDRTLLREALRAVVPGEVGSPGTSLGRGLPQVAAQVERDLPAVILLLSDGEETWEAAEEALQHATLPLQKARIPVCVMTFGDGQAHAVPPRPGAPAGGAEPTTSTAHPEFLGRLAQATGGQVFADGEAAAAGLQALAAGKLPLPASRSLQPAHPEVGAWLALAGLVLWLASAGKPLARWRPILLALAGLVAPPLAGQAPSQTWAPGGVKAWLAQRAIESGDLIGARKWRPVDAKPAHLLLAAHIDLRTGFPEDALKALTPLVGQGSPRPIPTWRAPALLLAARAHLEAQRPDEAKALLERLLLEQPGQAEAIHNLQTLVRDATPPPPPNPKKPPPPPPPRPSMGAQQDELEGLKQRLPKPPKTPGGVKDL
ncbi:MAG: tetratricopeptide repeat protein [Holophagaceae bacterium]|uniref:Tetratricopeptide repeat protein n=1 Tax=Candidatus Geothrix skivensis TaxID=2954439 RepID=A0A9D7SFE7_9BACT|nr:tetratricopeptide repeat protein [Candidatus Geothrix skivensis]